MKRALALLLLGGTAYAGGTQRPTLLSARGVGMGGAWTAWADDATALFFNPGALDTIDPHVMLGAEYVIGPRKFTPVAADGTRGDPQKTTVTSPVPSLGVVARFSSDDEPSRVTFGIGFWNTFGGRVSYPKTGFPALDSTQDLCLEVNGGASLHISDRLSIGGAIRLGIGMFAVQSTANPFDADLSANGVGVGATIGALFRPTDTLRIGLNWRSPLRITTKGDGTVTSAVGRPEVRHDQNWPQQVSLGVGLQTTPALKLAAQLDWSQWSQMDTIEVIFPNGELPDQVYPAYWEDNWAVRLGADYSLSQRFAVRAGTYYDTPAVPDYSLERQYSDSHKFGVSVGASVRAGAWRFDIAADSTIPRTRIVPDNREDVMGFTVLQNKSPGEYRGSFSTFELAAARQF